MQSGAMVWNVISWRQESSRFYNVFHFTFFVGQNNFKDVFFTMADIPFYTVHNALGFEFFGVNLFRFFTGVLTALGIIWLIRKIL